jgi:hypothetical protein
MAYEGYGDTPSHNTDYRSLSSPNDPYATDENLSKAIIRDLPSPDPDLDSDEKTYYSNVDVSSIDKRKRYGMRFAYMNAQEATRQI